MSLTLAHRLAVCAWLTETLKTLREEDLKPQAAREMPPGSRLPVMFGDRLAGWASMPKPSKTVTITDEKVFLAWVKREFPTETEEATEVRVTARVIEVLREHLPGALVTTEIVRPGFTQKIAAEMKERGGFVHPATGEKLTPPGLTLGESSPSPRVSLEANAAEVIGTAWRAGQVDVGELLALPAGEASGAA